MEDGRLLVGFRGPACESLGRLALELLGGTATVVPYEPRPLPSGPLEPCGYDDPEVVTVGEQGALRRVEGL